MEPSINFDIISKFALSYEQTRLMFSIEHYLITDEIQSEKTDDKKYRKSEWLQEWTQSIENYLRTLKVDEKKREIEKVKKEGTVNEETCLSEAEMMVEITKEEYSLYTDLNEIISICTEERKNVGNNRFPLFLILLEVSLFRPYYSLKSIEKKESDKKIDIKGKAKAFFNKIELCSEDRYLGQINFFANALGTDSSYIGIFNKSYAKNIKGISKYWEKMLITGLAFAVICAVTAGLASSSIAVLFAPVYLHGAAAISAGLAALGGGAIAAGGLGMAGGMAVIVGGGAIFGAASGTTLGAAISRSSNFMLSQAAKLEVIFKEIILTAQQDIRFAQEILNQQRRTIEALENEVFELRHSNNIDKERIKNLEKSIEYLKTAIERMKK